MLIMQRVIDSIQELLNSFEFIRAIETGTIRSHNEKHESTRHIAKTLGERGYLVSVDSNPKAIQVSKKICKKLKNIQWICSNSVEYLDTLTDETFHFALLDSANKPEVIWEEFRRLAPRMITGGIVMVDDAGIGMNGKRDNTNAKKGYMIWDKLGDIAKVVLAPHGTQLKIMFKKKNIKKMGVIS